MHEDTVLYRRLVSKGGRTRYEKTLHSVFDAFGVGHYLAVVEKGCRSTIRVLSPARAELLAAARAGHRAICDEIWNQQGSSKPVIEKSDKVRKRAWAAYAEVMKANGRNPVPIRFSGLSPASLADAVVTKLAEKADQADNPDILPPETRLEVRPSTGSSNVALWQDSHQGRLYTPEQAEQLARELWKHAAEARAMDRRRGR